MRLPMSGKGHGNDYGERGRDRAGRGPARGPFGRPAKGFGGSRSGGPAGRHPAKFTRRLNGGRP